MGLNKVKGHMYPWVDYTWNCVKGACKHDCQYCYMKVYKLRPARFDEFELRTDLGENNTIFVGSSNDMWCDEYPDEWILKVLDHCSKYDSNTYLFQSKNPARFKKFYGQFPSNVIFGTTIETNRHESVRGFSDAPDTLERYVVMAELSEDSFSVAGLHRTMVSIEPLMDFDLGELVDWIVDIDPAFVSIGADSKGHKLPEPSKKKTEALIAELREVTEVKVKKNLNRLLR